jgi:hypothetical protein
MKAVKKKGAAQRDSFRLPPSRTPGLVRTALGGGGGAEGGQPPRGANEAAPAGRPAEAAPTKRARSSFRRDRSRSSWLAPFGEIM